MKSALITGVTGQDGSYLAELLISKGYDVHGLVRRASMFNRGRIDHLRNGQEPNIGSFTLHYGELTDVTSFRRLLTKIRPDEIYHLAGQSHVALSFEIPEVTCSENGMGVLHILECVRDLDYPARLFLAMSSEIFGEPMSNQQDESTPLNPKNPYGCAKAFAAQLARVYRDNFGVFVVNGIPYNHESPRRGENFVTRKISLAAARIAVGDKRPLEIGNLNGRRDWGYAPEYVNAMWRALQASQADDYILATGETHTVRDFIKAAFSAVGTEIEFEGKAEAEIGRNTVTGDILIRVNPHYYRPVDAVSLCGNASRAKDRLGWCADTRAPEVARIMAKADFDRISASRSK